MTAGARQLYRITCPPQPGGQWSLGSVHIAGRGIPSGTFSGRPVGPVDDVVVDLYQSGPPMDFSFTVDFTPVVSEHVAALIESIAPDDVRRFPVRVQPGHPLGPFTPPDAELPAVPPHEPREVLNILHAVDCLDEGRSGIERCQHGHPSAGEIIVVTIEQIRLRVDAAAEHQIFVVAGFESFVIVADRLKAALEEDRVTGLRCWPAS